MDLMAALALSFKSFGLTFGALLRNVLANDPDNTVVHFNLGMALSDQGELADAVTCLKRLVKLELDSRVQHKLALHLSRETNHQRQKML